MVACRSADGHPEAANGGFRTANGVQLAAERRRLAAAHWRRLGASGQYEVMLRMSRLLAAGAFLVGILLGASVCGAASGAGSDATTAKRTPPGSPGTAAP
jgi:hypothetical protein